MRKILITGGAGYIGSHATLAFLQAGRQVVVLDNLCNSAKESLRRVEKLSGCSVDFVQGDIRDATLLDALFEAHDISAVMHFAGLKAVGESVEQPEKYYDNNVVGSLTLLQAMQRADIYNIVFSSSATVYGVPDQLPIDESHPVGTPTNPYGQSKLMVERIMQDIAAANDKWSIALLRYFNPVGAHASGQIGEDPNGIPSNLVPYISQVAIGQLQKLSVFGDDYPTKDGTGIRDYIHVVDLVEGHRLALDYISKKSGCHVWNLGTGIGYSVLEMISTFEKVSDKKVPFEIAPRRAGDIAACWANPQNAAKVLNWNASLGLEDMLRDTWRWQQANPNGYQSV